MNRMGMEKTVAISERDFVESSTDLAQHALRLFGLRRIPNKFIYLTGKSGLQDATYPVSGSLLPAS